MSYYENRIKALEERVAQLARDQRMKAIPVEAKLIERIANLQAENKRLCKAGDAVALDYAERIEIEAGETAKTLMKTLPVLREWNAAKEGKQS